jgi:hypothetical protein
MTILLEKCLAGYRGFLMSGVILLGATAGVCGKDAPATAAMGFTGPEIFPIDSGISHLRVADIDGDGLNDVVVVNNDRSKINILYNQTGKTNAVDKSALKRELNDLPPDARFHIKSIASEKHITSLVVKDLNGDGRPDLAYYGDPKELIVQYNQGTNGWSAPKKWAIEDGAPGMDALAAGDLNGDGLRDLILLGENCCYFLAQKKDHELAEPERLPYSGAVKAIQVLDINGDGKDDLLLVNWENNHPFRFRLQNQEGQLEPEIYFALAPSRSYLAEDLNGDHKTEIVTIALQSGRAQLSSFSAAAAASLVNELRAGQFQVMPLTKTGKVKRGVLWADIDGDQRADLLVSEPDGGQITLFRQKENGALDASRSFSTLTGVGEIAAADWDKDGHNEVFLLSGDERQIGVTRYENGKLPFPKILPVDGKPLAMAAGILETDAPPCLAVIVDQDGKRNLQIHRPNGLAKSVKLADSFKSNPTSLTLMDVDQDGLNDLVVLVPFEKIKILKQVAGGNFEEIDVTPPGGNADQPWLAKCDVDGDGKPELVLGQKNFVRAVTLQSEVNASAPSKVVWNLKVKEQINGAGSSSKITGAALVPKGSAAGGVGALFLLDAERKALSVCERDAAGVWKIVKNLPLPATDYAGLQPVALGGTNGSLAFIGLNSVAWMSFQGEVWELKELDGYETPVKDGYLHDVVAGAFNPSGPKDLVFLETAKNYVDLVSFEASGKLVPINRWRVFEERTFRSRRASEGFEPREACVAEVTGDKRNDLLLIVHDRVLLYPQE